MSLEIIFEEDARRVNEYEWPNYALSIRVGPTRLVWEGYPCGEKLENDWHVNPDLSSISLMDT
jgi:hypothetical protein